MLGDIKTYVLILEILVTIGELLHHLLRRPPL